MTGPTATYRLQFTPSFTFGDAEEIVGYLAALGIGDIYASPVFEARTGSTHGYDVVDPNRVRGELGGEDGFRSLTARARESGLGWVQDIVPNHMAFSPENALLMDVLENGAESPYYNFFDIDWNHPYESIRGRLLAPFLGRFYSEALEDGEITLRYDRDGFSVGYYDWRFPLSIESYAGILAPGVKHLAAELGSDSPDYVSYLGILYVIETLSAADDVPVEESRAYRAAFVKRLLRELYTSNDSVRKFVDRSVKEINGVPGKPETFDRLEHILGGQHFRLSFWKVATAELNYRRFFSINDLIAVRTQDPEVFDVTHDLLACLAKEGVVTGLRIDHIDGLYDPGAYLDRLRRTFDGIYTVVEKIVDYAHEDIPAEWPVEGTTGYEFLNQVNGLFCDRANAGRMTVLYRNFTGQTASYHYLVTSRKRLIIGKHMAGDIDNLAHTMKRISAGSRYGYDITLYALRRALVEVMTQFPVYRTYISERGISRHDRAVIEDAVERATANNPELAYEFTFIRQFLILGFEEHVDEERRRAWYDFVNTFQQFTGPLMAKGFEDTLFYVYNRLISLNEVGGDPQAFGVTLTAFHRYNRHRAARHPRTMIATATHDMKRGEDMRTRIDVLSEIPGEWRDILRHWHNMNRPHKTAVHGHEIPDRNDEYFLYQTFLGAYPFDEAGCGGPFRERIRDYSIKAVREAKMHTAWLKPDDEYERGFLAFIDALLADGSPFMESFLPFQRRIAFHGVLNSLSQTALKLTAPGIPDFYQGSELWDLSLVDPDNRRPVDYGLRERYLDDIRTRSEQDRAALLDDLMSSYRDGRIKQYLIYHGLSMRRARPGLFAGGSYIPIRAAGMHRNRVVAFARRTSDSGEWAVTVCPRLTTGLVGEDVYPLGDVWDDTTLTLPGETPRRFRDVLTGDTREITGPVPLGTILNRFPVALLHSEE